MYVHFLGGSLLLPRNDGKQLKNSYKQKDNLAHFRFHITSTRWPTVRPLRSCGKTLKYLPRYLNCTSGRPPLLFQHIYYSSYLFRLAIFLPLIPLCEILSVFRFPLFWRCEATALTHVDTIKASFSAIYMNTFPVQPFSIGARIMQRSL